MFSPYYARARRRGRADPLDHCAINAVLYGPRGKRWAMTERGRNAVSRSDSSLSVGSSTVSWDRGDLVIAIDETCMPFPFRLRGTIRISAGAMATQDHRIDAAGRHVWRPIMPSARIQVAMDEPALSWSGHGYCDHNRGAAALEDDFEQWSWARLSTRDGSAILYDTEPRAGRPISLALRYGADAKAEPFEAPPFVALPKTRWRITRPVRTEAPEDAAARTLEDTPFYARSVVSTRLFGRRVAGMHESLSLDRFASRWVQTLLPFRMPRRAG